MRNPEYAARLNQAMKAASMSTGELAACLGITYTAVRKVREGLSGAFNAANNSRAAKFLGVNPCWLATGTASDEFQRGREAGWLDISRALIRDMGPTAARQLADRMEAMDNVEAITGGKRT